jgi:ankyrin repeat protein
MSSSWESTHANEALILSVWAGSIQGVKAALEAGADPDVLDEGFSSGYSKLPILFIAIGWRPGDYVKAEYTEIVTTLLEYSADSNPRNDDDQTPLMFALELGKLNIARALIDHGADVNAQDKFGRLAALFWAIDGGYEIVRTLLERGADVNIQDSDGWTPLMWATHDEKYEIARLLIEHGADTSLRTNDNKTALSIAQEEQVSRELIEMLEAEQRS